MVRLLLVCLVIGSSLVEICECGVPLPAQLHCSSVLFLRSAKSSVKIYNVVEYLDAKALRSSVLVEDVEHNDMQIYYNQVARDGPRQFIKYEPKRWTCLTETVAFWEFNELRRLAIFMSDLGHLVSENVDVPIGPSVLLYAVSNNDAKFQYVGSTYSKARSAHMRVYSYGTLLSGPATPRMWVNVMIHVPADLIADLEPQVGEPLSAFLEKVPAGLTKIALVGACIMSSQSAEDYVPEMDLKKEGELNPKKLDEDNFCPQDKILFTVRFNIVDEHHPGTLLGKGLNQIGWRHEYHREPFLRPVGIGCWGHGNVDDDDSEEGQQVYNLVALGQAQFSALYTKERGSLDVSFVAYDHSFNLLRIDQEGRKSIYDLVTRRSYHVGEFGASEASPSFENEKCVVLDMDDTWRRPDEMRQLWRPSNHDPLADSADGKSVLAQLIGLSHDQGREHHIGMRVIDHVAYEVYELAIERLRSGQFDVPLLLWPDKPVAYDESFRLFSTFYLRLESGATPQLKFIELWAFDKIKKRKIFVNRVKFVEFSWALDVEPANDAESQTTDMGLFNLGPCYQSRASRSELLIHFKRGKQLEAQALRQLTYEKQVALLRANRPLLLTRVAHLLTENMRLVRSNLFDLKLEVAPNGDLFSKNLVVDLREGMLQMSQLGLIDRGQSPKWRQFLRRATRGAHWLRDCQLYSIALREPNWLAHCAGSSSCLLFKPDEEFRKTFLAVDRVNVEDEPTTCVVFSLKYTTVDTVSSMLSATTRADLNFWRVVRSSFKISLPYWQDKQVLQFEYEAQPQLKKLELLDPLGARLANDAAFLKGLRHTTAVEEAAGINSNLQIALTVPKLSPLQHCQLACQLDDHCASFSVCQAKSASGGRASECVLSNLRLNGDRISELISSGASGEKKDRYEVRVTNECESQSFVLVRDDACSLHPRDFLADYQRRQPTTLIGNSLPSDEGLAAPKRDHAARVPDKDKVQPVSLEECASRNFERCSYKGMRASNFTYCPLESLCLQQDADLTDKELAARADALSCFVYAKRVGTSYLINRQTEMRVTLDRSRAAKGDARGQRQQDGAQVERPARHFVRFLWGADEETCARECNLHRSNCLSFDLCRYARHTMCSLYSIRSPADSKGAYAPLTWLERQTRESFSIRLAGSSVCTHHHLKPLYFQVRLAQIISKDPVDGGEPEPAPKSPNEKRLDELEELISSSDAAKSKEELELVERETEQLADRLSRTDQEESQSFQFHTVTLLAGLAVGCVCAMFKEQILQVAGRVGQQVTRTSGFVRHRGEAASADGPSGGRPQDESRRVFTTTNNEL